MESGQYKSGAVDVQASDYHTLLRARTGRQGQQLLHYSLQQNTVELPCCDDNTSQVFNRVIYTHVIKSFCGMKYFFAD